MTFSLVARDAASGAFGMVVSSSSPAVASRCTHLRSRTGAVASQNVTNPALGTAVLDALDKGSSAQEALQTVLDDEPHPAYRQLSVIDAAGRTAHHSGHESLGINHSASGESAVAAGNLLHSPSTVASLLAGYEGSSSRTFEGRLLDGLRAAMDAGGEAGPVRSAGLRVVEEVSWATTDLRVDDADAPIDELLRLWDIWKTQKHDYLIRALRPERAPSYGVAGDE